MIVTDDMVHTALEYLAIDPHPVALARKDVTDAENEREALKAELFSMQNEGSIKEREYAVERNHSYRAAKRAEADAECEYERHRSKVRAAEMLISVWQSEGANARAAGRVV